GLGWAGQGGTRERMLAWIAQDRDAALASETAAHLMLPSWRRGDEPQPVPGARAAVSADPTLERVLAMMEENVEEPLPCAEIARRAGISMRRMQRLFAKTVGTSPVRHYQFARLTKAHALLQQTDLSGTEIAANAGFGALEHV